MSSSVPLGHASHLRALARAPEQLGELLCPGAVEPLLALARCAVGVDAVALRLVGGASFGRGVAVPASLDPVDAAPEVTVRPLRLPGEGAVLGALAVGAGAAVADLDALADRLAAALVGLALERAASIDPLTWLPTRSAFERALPGLTERLAAGGSLAVLLVDVDGLDAVNRDLGRAQGDRLLAAVASCLREVAGDGALLARLGGDELGAALSGVDAAGAEAAGRALVERVGALAGFGAAPGVTVGLAVGPEHARLAEELVVRAEWALAHGKAAGGGAVTAWSRELRRAGRPGPAAGILTGDAARDRRNVEALLATIHAVTGLAPLEQTLARVVERCVTVADARRGLLLVREEGAWRVRASHGERAEQPAFARSIADEALRAQGVVSRLAGPEGEISPSAERLGVKAVLCAPLQGADLPEAVVYVDTPRILGAFDAATLAFFEAHVAEVGTALRNAHLYDQALASNRELRSDVAGREAELARVRALWERDRRDPPDPLAAQGIVGQSSVMQDVFRLLRCLEGTEVPVVIEGESGTGKELLARALHARSPRKDGPWVTVNCAAIAEGLFESELFGHARGAFTGAHAERVGLLEVASGGTLFLDEVGELPLEAQGKLLRTLQEGEVRRVGEAAPRKIDTRIVAATNRDLQTLVGLGEFRQDLYYRLAVFKIRVPPLRERLGDLPLLIDYVLEGLRAEGARVGKLEQEARIALARRPWRGNVRELRNALRRACVLAGEGPIRAEHVEPDEPTTSGPGPAESELLFLPFKQAKARFTELYARQAIERARGSVSEAARLAGVTRQTLYRALGSAGE